MAAVETIESLRRELNALKDERRLMEDKLRTLIGRIDQAGSDAEPDSTSDAESTTHSYSSSGTGY
jgi:hypothetical protein